MPPLTLPTIPLTLCLITDRRRLLSRVQAPAAAWRRVLLSQIRGAIVGGVSTVQIREHDLDAADLVAFARECVEAARGSHCRIVVNDRVDVAIAAGAHGVQLRERSMSVADARGLTALHGIVIGRSVHDAATAAGARVADYLLAGSVFETASKPGRPASLGLAGLRAVVDAAGECPVWAVGGITPHRVAAVTHCGVRGVAAIDAFLPESSAAEGDVEVEVMKLAQAMRISLDFHG